MADPAGGLGEQRNALGDLRRELDRPLSRHRADPHLAVVRADVRERGNPVEIDQRRGPAQAEVQERDQALTAGQDLGLAAVAGEQGQRLVDGRRRVVIELGWFHGFLASRISGQSRVGVIGSSVMRIPSGDSASLTALASTAGTVIELDSPRPLEPSVGSGEGETTWAVWISG